ncbi:MAG: GAF domain-containing sensor histidine kinase [Bacteroidetes bacterium]|nr:GAF domain-containing sensor histidine kinase [Bacteroidota bacterium]
MIKPKIPFNEKERLRNLKEFEILDSLPEEDFDSIAALAAYICQTPISLITLIDENRQWFKSKHGLSVSETPRDVAFCAHAINNSNSVFMIPDSRTDDRFHDNPLVTGDPHVIFYAGMPLVSQQGFALGTLCVIDSKPHNLTDDQVTALTILSKQTSNLFALRRQKRLLELATTRLENKNKELIQFAHVAAHDLKSPLFSITGLTSLISEEYAPTLDPEVLKLVLLIHNSSELLTNLISGILEDSKSEGFLSLQEMEFNLDDLFSDLMVLLNPGKEYTITFPQTHTHITTNKTALNQIFLNLISNSIKYCDKEKVVIEVGFSETVDFYNFSVTDNGPGIKKEYHERIFNIFDIETHKDRFGKRGNGIGLSTVKKLVEGLGGEISVSSELTKWTKMDFSISK